MRDESRTKGRGVRDGQADFSLLFPGVSTLCLLNLPSAPPINCNTGFSCAILFQEVSWLFFFLHPLIGL